jgi:hypothetical protein
MLSLPYFYFLLLSAIDPENFAFDDAQSGRGGGIRTSSSVLETDSLTVELTPLNAKQGLRDQGLTTSESSQFPIPHAVSSSLVPTVPALLRFPVLPVATAALAELRELKTAGGRLFVLRRRVVALLALGALQCHNFPHLRILSDSVPIAPRRSSLKFQCPV